MRAGLVLITGLALLFGGAVAASVTESLRPELRPGSGAVSTAVVISVDVPVHSLRPRARPDVADGARVVLASGNTGFDRWIAGFRARAASAGIRGDVLDRAFRGVRYDPEVVAKDRNQSEFKREIWDYLDATTSPKRVEDGRAALRRHSRVLNRIEAHYGVEKEIVTAVWGMESAYGTRLGDLPLVQSLATLAYDGRRGAFFEKQLIAAMQILQSGDVNPRDMKGSWAGAMGHTQFIPTSYLAYAVDFTGDGRRDVWSDDPTDALASTAAYLKRFGWRKGMPWGVEVRVPRGASFGNTSRMPSDWASRGVVGTDGRAVRDYGSARILQPAGPAGASFMVFANFDVIKRYNNADAYALGVGHLADRIAGGPPIQASWPRGYDPLSFDERKEMQRRLKRKGFAVEKIDGIVGPNTVEAIRAFQRSVGAEADGLPSQQLLSLLRRS
ncbi:lytic murein transglycosylase [Roseovarius nitratireducens]|uniref:lytic murein transglycosylase n=1 Tax=Roseovarius nitratireducens TaxID=2044597 RepID=UPI000CE1CD7A|nr:lytic murein transglycosylase [Roseovarius nitratireducens]